MRCPQTSWLACSLILSVVVSLPAAALAEESPSLLDQAAAAAVAPENIQRMVERLLKPADKKDSQEAIGILYGIPPLAEAVAWEFGRIVADADADLAVRAQAATVLVEMYSLARSQIDILIATMTADDLAMRRSAVTAVERLAMNYVPGRDAELARAIGPLAERAIDTNEDHEVRQVAIMGLAYLCRSNSPIAVAALVKVAQGNDNGLAATAVAHLSWFGPGAAEARAPLRGLLGTAPDKLKVGIVGALLDIGAEPGVVAPSLRDLLSSEDASTRRDALATLRSQPAIHEFVEDVAALLGDPDSRVRSEALGCLQMWEVTPLPTDAVELLTEYLLALPHGSQDEDDEDEDYEDDEDDEDSDDLIDDPDLGFWAEQNPFEKNASEMAYMLFVQGGRRRWPAMQRVYADGQAAARLAVIETVWAHAYKNITCPDGVLLSAPPAKLMIQALDDPADEIRRAAALWLAYYNFLPDERLAALIGDMPFYTGEETRPSWTWGTPSVWKHPSSQIAQALHLALAADNPLRVRLAAIELCRSIEGLPDELVADLIDSVKGGPYKLAWSAADVLIEPKGLSPQAIEPLLDLLTRSVGGLVDIDFDTSPPQFDPDWSSVASALIAAGRAGAVLAPLEKSLAHDDVHWRLQALDVLAGRLGPNEPQKLTDLRSRAPTDLKDLFQSPDPHVRLAVVTRAESLAPTDAVDILLAALEDSNEAVRSAAVDVLWDLAPAHADRVIPALITVIGDAVTDGNLRSWARVALGYYRPGAEVLPDLLRIALDDDHPGAWSAASAWGDIYREARQAETDKQ